MIIVSTFCDTGWGRGLTPKSLLWSLEQVPSPLAYNMANILRLGHISMIQPLVVRGRTAPKKKEMERENRKQKKIFPPPTLLTY